VIGVRIDNLGQQAMEIAGAEVVGSDLVPFGGAALDGSAVAGGDARTWELAFPYPEGAPLALRDLAGLSVRLQLVTPERTANVELGFTRLFHPSGSSSSFHFGFGVGVYD
jgi:hypothetical protein